MKTNPKTLQKIELLKKSILLNNFDKKMFYYNEVEKLTEAENLSVMYFYYFVYADCFIKVNGKYTVTDKFYTLKSSDIYAKAQIQLKSFRRIREEKIRSGEILKPIKKVQVLNVANIDITISQSIEILKKAGYRILKPIAQFEEI